MVTWVADQRSLLFIENMVTIYRSLDASFSASLFQSSLSDTGRFLEQCPTSRSAYCNDRLSNESFKISQDDNPSSGGPMFFITGNKLVQVPLDHSIDNGILKIDLGGACNMTRDLKDNKTEMFGSGGDEGNGEKNVNSPPLSSRVRVCGLHELEATKIVSDQVDLLSAGNPPSSDHKNSENDTYGQDGESPENYQVASLAKRNTDASRTEGGNLRDSKRHKKLKYGLNECSNKPISSQIENLGPCYSQSAHKSLSLNIGETLAPLDDPSVARTVCGFCQSSRICKDTGPMLHFVNGKPVEGDEASLSDAIHVHKQCFEWAPQVYFIDETVKNLKEELARGAKLKCSGCGLKGAALGCYKKSCRRSYHVTCAMEVAGCRWDCDNYLLLCPSHSSVRFPDEKKPKSKKYNLEHSHVPAQIAPQQSNFWTESSNGAKEWVFCGSALSSEEKCLLVEFGSRIDVPVTKFWRPSVTHVIAATNTNGACTRTLKVLMAILNGKWVLTMDWVKACMKAMLLVDEEPYEVNLDNYGCHDGPRTGRLSVLNNAPKLFNGLNFYFSGDFVACNKEDLQNLVITAGGNIMDHKEELVQQSHDQVTAPSKTLVVYNVDPPQERKLGEEEDTILSRRRNEAEELATKIGSQVIGHTWLLESVASYKLQPFVSSHW